MNYETVPRDLNETSNAGIGSKSAHYTGIVNVFLTGNCDLSPSGPLSTPV